MKGPRNPFTTKPPRKDKAKQQEEPTTYLKSIKIWFYRDQKPQTKSPRVYRDLEPLTVLTRDTIQKPETRETDQEPKLLSSKARTPAQNPML